MITVNLQKKRQFKRFIAILIIHLATLFYAALAHATLNIEHLTLPNGIKLLLVEKHNLPLVTVSIGIDAGTLFEPSDKPGLANLTAELLTEGTTHRTSSQIGEEIEFMGAELSTAASKDLVSVDLSILKKDVNRGFEILADVLLNPSFPDEELQKLKTRVLGQIKLNQEQPDVIANQAFIKALFGLGHPYGRPVIGSAEFVTACKREDISQFYGQFYRPNRTIIAIVGDITKEEIVALMEKNFSQWKPSETATQPLTHSLNQLIKDEAQLVQIDRKDLSQATVIIGHKGVSRDNPDYVTVAVMNYILGSGDFSSRLMDNIRENLGLVYGVYSYFDSAKAQSFFLVNLQTKNENANQAIHEVVKQLKVLKENGVTEKELADAKSFLTGSFPLRLETNDSIADRLVAIEYYGLGYDFLDKYAERINGITKQEIDRVAKRYLFPDNAILVIVGHLDKIKVRR
jgi:zinc protease